MAENVQSEDGTFNGGWGSRWPESTAGVYFIAPFIHLPFGLGEILMHGPRRARQSRLTLDTACERNPFQRQLWLICIACNEHSLQLARCTNYLIVCQLKTEGTTSSLLPPGAAARIMHYLTLFLCMHDKLPRSGPLSLSRGERAAPELPRVAMAQGKAPSPQTRPKSSTRPYLRGVWPRRSWRGSP